MAHNTTSPDDRVNNSFPPWKSHIRLHPEMYIGNPGNGSLPDDGIYRLISEVLEVAINESDKDSNHLIELTIDDKKVTIRDYGNQIHMDQLVEYVSERNLHAIGSHKEPKVDPRHYGIGLKVVNLLSATFAAQSFKKWKTKVVEFEQGWLICETSEEESFQPSGNKITFTPDIAIFGDFHFVREYVVQMLWRYAFLNEGLEIKFDGQSFKA